MPKEIGSSDIMHIGFLKKECFTGSSEGMRYRMERAEGEEGEILLATVWPEPFSFQATPEEQKTRSSFPFTEEGVEQARFWLNEQKRGIG